MFTVYYFRFDNGNGAARLRSSSKILLNQWNAIVASRSGSTGSLIVNGGVAARGSSPGTLTQLNVDDVSYLGGPGEDWTLE